MDEINRMLARQRQADLVREAQRSQLAHAARAAARLGLPRELWLVVLGIFLNYVGYGAVLPFEVIYLHDGRGFSLGVAGLVVGLITGVAVVTAPLAGPLIDRFGARAVAAGAGVVLAAGYTGLAFVYSPAQAFVAAAIAGAGNGALNPSQSTLVATLAPAQLRHRANAVSRVAANVGVGIGGGVGGLVAAYGLTGFVALFLANGVTYLIYVCVLIAVVREDARPEPITGGYRLVVRDRAFVQLALTNVAMIAVGWGVFTWLVPPYAKDEVGISAQLIGLLMLANAATVVVAQVPIAVFAEGRRRAVMMALAAWMFVAACLLVLAAGTGTDLAIPALFVAAVLVGAGECFHTTVLMPLAADLAPAGLRGRYMASMGLSWWIGLAIASAFGAQLLSVSPTAAFLAAAVVALVAGVSALTLERRLPDACRLTPRPHRSPDK
ncbi:MFS transporter [Acrocarpospora macrocephala]|uniref:MFS transporter n=1 Tax=Acrocarpospora macrocephala TaxID=150177 RepID=A0A5M3WPA9_9ACTN|nr:MFS transporter [Acrocarpospora macrocephala]GES11157.1 MFS transporter [Acrocarpospora macrocephala]